MPGMDGLEAIPEIRRRRPDIAIVILSGFSASRMERKARERGADGYVEKGTPMDDLRQVVRDAVERHASKKGNRSPERRRAAAAARQERGTQDSNLESPTLEAGALASLASAPKRPNRSREADGRTYTQALAGEVSTVAREPSKLEERVRFPSPA